MGKFQDVSATRILREITLGHLEAPKTAILSILAGLNFEFLGNHNIFKYDIFQKTKFKASKIVKTAVFDRLKSAKIDFTYNQSCRKIANFQSKIPIRLPRSMNCSKHFFSIF